MEEEKKELQPENLEQVAGGVPPIIKMRGPCPKCGKNTANYTINPNYKTIQCDSCGYYEEIQMKKRPGRRDCSRQSHRFPCPGIATGLAQNDLRGP